MKRFYAWMIMLVVSLSVVMAPASASSLSGDVIDLGDGFYMVETISSCSLSRSGDTVYGNKTGNIYQGSTLIGVATLYASFDISGSTAEATFAQIDGTGRNGGVYSQGTSRYSGNTASGSAYFTYNGMEKVGRLTITCSPNGTLS
jgi:hypothetical protein